MNDDTAVIFKTLSDEEALMYRRLFGEFPPLTPWRIARLEKLYPCWYGAQRAIKAEQVQQRKTA
jgi:hypothetical protein